MATDTPTAEDETTEEVAPATGLSKPVMLGIGGAGTAAVFGLIWFLTNEAAPPPEKLFAESLNLLDAGDVRRAGNIARYLEDLEYRDLDFGGGVEFVLGMSEFELGANYSVDEHTRQQHYEVAAEYLDTAFSEGLVLDRRPSWAYAHGLSLYRLRRRVEAEPRLIEALDEYPAGRRPVAIALARCDLDESVRTDRRMKRALRLCDEVLTDPDASEVELADAWLLRAETTLLKEGPQAADTWTSRSTMPESLTDDFRLNLLAAKIANGLGNVDDAIAKLRAIIESRTAPADTQRAAAYELARTYDRRGDDESAIEAYRSVLDNYDQSDETIVAAVLLGNILRRPPRTLYEDALKAYYVAVQIGIDPERYRNRYASLNELRDHVRAAWQDWLLAGEYRWSINMAERMAPLFLKADAADMAAASTQTRAQVLSAEYENATETERRKLEPELLAAWRETGDAYTRVAKARITQSRYPDALWTSAEHYIAGHDYTKALEKIGEFLKTGTESRRPRALVNYGLMQMNLHRPGGKGLTEAAATFEQMLANYPTSDAAFDARYALGECYLEKNQPERAKEQWQKILDSDVLSPASLVWQDALVSLGDLHFHEGEHAAMLARAAEQRSDFEEAAALRDKANARWAAAVSQLQAYLYRSPDSERSAMARFWLAKSLQRSIEQPRAQLKTAETRNAKLELERQINDALDAAMVELRTLRRRLAPMAVEDNLALVAQRVLRDATFESAHTLFLQGKYDQAIDAYNEAANSYPNDPQVLLAYLQAARCFDELDRPSDALSQLKRARIIREQLDAATFTREVTGFSSLEWDRWLTRTLELMSTLETSTDT